jgi:hypothetical protein
MASLTYAQARAQLAETDAAYQYFCSMISGQNPDGTAFSGGGGAVSISGAVPILQPSVAGNTGGAAVTATSGVVAAATATCTLPAVAAKFTWLTGFVVSGTGATASASVTMTVAGVVSGTQSYAIGVPPLTAAPIWYPVEFNPAVPSSAVNTAIVLTLPSLGTGNLGVSVNATGFYL